MRLFRRGDSASSLDLLVAGLGNPGREYTGHRHNVGHMVVDELARRHGGSWRGKFSGDLSELRIGEARVALLKPMTYMNESGRSRGAAVRFFKLPPPRPLADYVLSNFEPEDEADSIVARAADAVEAVVAEGLEAAQRAYH